ncbi:IPO7 [Lepeophtheirus salmonis]|uniref:IPO7 n=1 Tax=Lepeophtheirus salmonis TaxID=72036 RepID=A0A7R8D0R0_LEPSM|nr:IPO7 [Lepeophtheirus salmonis]CAF2986329.1 IPO7 [Lepeophtheirus salmonis]
MDPASSASLLKRTLDPNLRNEAEAELSKIHKIIGFTPVILRVIVSREYELPVRQAGAVYLKNIVSSSWQESGEEENEFSIHEQDRALIRENLVRAIVSVEEVLQKQLTTCLSSILKVDFPGKWPQIVDQIAVHLQEGEGSMMGSLLALYQLVKNYEYKKKEQRTPCLDAMNLLLPLLTNLFTNSPRYLQDPDPIPSNISKLMLKIYFALTQYVLPLQNHYQRDLHQMDGDYPYHPGCSHSTFYSRGGGRGETLSHLSSLNEVGYSRRDAELWEADPFEYIRIKFDIFEDFVSPVTAAQTLLYSVCRKHGALHMIGTMGDILLKKKNYKDQMESFLVNVYFQNLQPLRVIYVQEPFHSLKTKKWPVKVEAAIALKNILSNHEAKSRPYVEPKIREISLELLKVIRETESDDLASVMQKLVFNRDGYDYFTDIMPTLHNYVTVDTDTFLSNPDFITAIFNMCKKMLETLPGEDPQCHAAKMLEVLILQCNNKGGGIINKYLPAIIQITFTRLATNIRTSELRTMCLQVAIAAMYSNTNLFFETLQGMTLASDCFIGLHDRKICVIGLCQLLTMPTVPGVEAQSSKLIPSLLLLFDGLNRAYEARANKDSSDDDSDDDDDDGEDDCDLLNSDEDDMDDEGAAYLDQIEAKVKSNSSGFDIQCSLEDALDDSDDEYYCYEDTPLESYTTPLDEEDSVDEYIFFKNSNIDSLNEIFLLGTQRLASKESENIKKAGGYNFNQMTVTGQFNFGDSSQFPFGKQQ